MFVSKLLLLFSSSHFLSILIVSLLCLGETCLTGRMLFIQTVIFSESVFFSVFSLHELEAGFLHQLILLYAAICSCLIDESGRRSNGGISISVCF